MIRVDISCKPQSFSISGCSVRHSLLWGLVNQKRVHGDVVTAFLGLIGPALKSSNTLARPPHVCSTLLTMRSVHDPTSKHMHLVEALKNEVKEKNPRRIIFPTFVDYDGVVPNGAKGCHWVLLVLDFNSKSWKLFDSLSHDNPLAVIENARTQLVSLAELFELHNPEIEYVKSTRQSCLIDCGIFMLANILSLIFGTSVNPFPISTSELRRRLFAFLLLGATPQRTCKGSRNPYEPQPSSTKLTLMLFF